jgi:hypothetical protein
MTSTTFLKDAAPAGPADSSLRRTGDGITDARPKDDKAMLRAAADLTRELNAPSRAIYWTDMIGSALAGYGALALAIFAGSVPLMLVAGVVSILAL